MKALKILIWVYLVLLLIEGALRKWVFPGYADLLLIVRDPVLLAIYGVALARGQFPVNGFVKAAGILAVLCVVASILGGNTNVLVILYGVRINYLHLPLIWIMGAVLDRRDVERIGAFLLVMAIPMCVLMIAQFRSPADSLINRGVGHDEIGQLFGVENHIRPPGLFSFITGPQLFFPLCTAFFFDEISGARRLPVYLLILCGLAVAVSLPISISRSVMLGAAVVAVVFLCVIPFLSARASTVLRPLFILLVIGAGLSQLPIFREGTSVFMLRWDAAGIEEGAWTSVMNRTVNAFTNPVYFIKEAPFFGYGIGTGSNVGARLISGSVGFNLAEEEWGKVLLELGPALGVAFIVFRIVLTFTLGRLAWRALRERRDVLPLLIWAAMALTVLQGQWAPPTVLGFCVVGSGLLLGSLRSRGQRATVAEVVATPSVRARAHHQVEAHPALQKQRLPPGNRSSRR
jgi:hypothetical protein